jgi:hypothetical protein
MIGDGDNRVEQQDDDEATAEAPIDETAAKPSEVDNVGDLSVEINVEELVAKVESAGSGETDKDREIRKKLDEVQAKRNNELDSTYNFNLDDDL